MDNKNKILKVSLNLFIKEGFHGTSTAKIAAEAGISNGSLFHHFKTKEELISKLYINLKEDYKNYLLENMKPCRSNKSKIKQLWYTCVKWYLENEDGVIFFTMFSNSPYVDNLSKEEVSRNFNFIYETFQEAIDEEVIINVDSDLIMHFFYSSIRAFSNYARENPLNLEENMEIAFKMWWRSVANI